MGDDLHDGEGLRATQVARERILGWRGWFVPPAKSSMPTMLYSPHMMHVWAKGTQSWGGQCRCGAWKGEWVPPMSLDKLLDLEQAAIRGEQDPSQPLPKFVQRFYRRCQEARRPHQMPRYQDARMFAITAGESQHVDVNLVWAVMLAMDEVQRLEAGHKEREAQSRLQCQCGVNAFATIEQLIERGYTEDEMVTAIGRVELWGEVRSFERGWRAEHAQAAEVWALREFEASDVRQACVDAGIAYRGVWPSAS
jgi:hypothetical protein